MGTMNKKIYTNINKKNQMKYTAHNAAFSVGDERDVSVLQLGDVTTQNSEEIFVEVLELALMYHKR